MRVHKWQVQSLSRSKTSCIPFPLAIPRRICIPFPHNEVCFSFRALERLFSGLRFLEGQYRGVHRGVSISAATRGTAAGSRSMRNESMQPCSRQKSGRWIVQSAGSAFGSVGERYDCASRTVAHIGQWSEPITPGCEKPFVSQTAKYHAQTHARTDISAATNAASLTQSCFTSV